MNPTSSASHHPSHGSSEYKWLVSVVSHGHGASVVPTLRDFTRHLSEESHCIVVTLNAGEDARNISETALSANGALRIIRNDSPLGFGENHNRAANSAQARYLMIADPDLRLPDNIFPAIERELAVPDRGFVAPRATRPSGAPIENARATPTPLALMKRYLAPRGGAESSMPATDVPRECDWLAGFCMATRMSTFQGIRGFDTSYFMYCEDIDICLRAREQGFRNFLVPESTIFHPAARSKGIRHAYWHTSSMLKFWTSPVYRSAVR